MFYLLTLFVIFIFVTYWTKQRFCKNRVDAMEQSTYLEEINIDGVKKTIRKPKCPRCGNKDLQYQIVSTGARERKYIDGVHISNTERAICTKCGHNFTPIVNPSPGCSVWFFAVAAGLLAVAISSFAFALINIFI